MARKAIVDRDLVLNYLREGKTTQYIAEQYGVSRQAIDLHRRDFISRGLLPDQRAAREKEATKEPTKKTVPPKQSITSLNQQASLNQRTSLDQQIELIIEAFAALKRLPELEAELEKYQRDYQDALREIERLRAGEQKRRGQEQRLSELMNH